MGFATTRSSSSTAGGNVPIGGYADVFTSGANFKLVGSVISRAQYPEMSNAYPRSGAINAVNSGPMPANQAWLSTAYGAGVHVAVGGSNGNSAAFSDDAKTWYFMQMPVQLSYRTVAFGADLFVAMGTETGSATTSFATSKDGVNWTARTFQLPYLVSSLIYSKELSLFIASCGYSPNSTSPQTTLLTSVDGLVWKPIQVPSKLWTSVASGPKGIAVISTDSTESGSSVCLSSADGITFTQRAMPPGHWMSVTQGKGVYVAVGYKQSTSITMPIIATSTDLETWTLRNMPVSSTAAGPGCVAFGDSVFVAIWNAITLVSYDGLVWIQKTSLMSQPPPNQIGYKDGVLIIGYSSSQSTVLNVTLENLTDSNWMYLSGTAGKYLRVK
jgi:hypothetical protein